MTDVIEVATREVVVLSETAVEVLEVAQQGPQGPAGAAGAQGPPGGGVTWKNAWNPATAYSVNDGVTYGGSSWRRIVAGTTATAPDVDAVNWTILALKGADGSNGTNGADGTDGVDGADGPDNVLVGKPVDPVVAGDDGQALTYDHGGSKWVTTDVATQTELNSEAATRGAADTANAGAAAAAQATADAALPKAGGTMTGTIVLAADPSAALHPVTRQYLEAAITALINGAPGALDTLKEISDQLATDESAVAALTTTVAGKLAKASNLSDLVDAAIARTNLGLGTAATHAHGDYDAAGAAAAAQAASQPLDADLTAIAALATTAFGRALLALADAAAGRTAFGLDTAATHPATDFQPIDSDLTAIAALATTAFGRSLLTQADAPAALNTLIPYVTALPGSPTDGQQVFFGADPTNGVIWHLRYRSAVSKWESVGGSDLASEVDTSQTTASTAFVDLATVGPSITLPLAGDYDFFYGDEGSMSNTSGFKVIALMIAGAEVTADELVVLGAGPTNGLVQTSRKRRKTGLASGSVVKLQYRVTGGTGTFRSRWLRARPVRVS